jgi:hypothetical protein
MNVEQDILMDDMNEQDEKILSDDYLIIENILYGISKRNKMSFFLNIHI